MPHSQRALKYLEDIVYKRNQSIFASFIRIILVLLSFVYIISIKIYMKLMDYGLLRKHRLNAPVISVGNITVGGTGKTPFVQYLAKTLLELGCKTAILSYGYGGKLKGEYGVVSDYDAILLDAAAAGDEPVMLAESLPGIPVIVSKHRHISGSKAIELFKSDVLLLDDGFQVWKLYRDLDIVLLNINNPFDNRHTLPAGKLREPVSALKKAGCVIVTGDFDERKFDEIRDTVHAISHDIPVISAEYAPDKIILLSDGSVHPIEYIQGKKVFAISSIGNPASFRNTLQLLKLEVVGIYEYIDHYSYTQSDVDTICSLAAAKSASFIITTTKDAVKLKNYNFTIPAAAVSIKMRISDEERLIRIIKKTVNKNDNK